MLEIISLDLFGAIVAVIFVHVVRTRAGKARLSALGTGLVAIVGGAVIPTALFWSAKAWRSVPSLPSPPVITSGQIFLGTWTALLLLSLTHRKGKPPALSLWTCLAAGVAVAALLPPSLDAVTGRYQPASFRDDVNHCIRWEGDTVENREAINRCAEPVTVGLCLPDEVNPSPCAQSFTLAKGERARFDPRNAGPSSLPSNANGYTVVACLPPARPSRTLSNVGRGYQGVCLPPL